MEIIIIILLVLLALEVKFSPRLGFTKENAILLWYGKNKRNYITRVNEFLTAKYNLDNAEKEAKIMKNKYNKQMALLIWSVEKLKKDIKK